MIRGIFFTKSRQIYKPHSTIKYSFLAQKKKIYFLCYNNFSVRQAIIFSLKSAKSINGKLAKTGQAIRLSQFLACNFRSLIEFITTSQSSDWPSSSFSSASSENISRQKGTDLTVKFDIDNLH